jgi:hypothetical protein
MNWTIPCSGCGHSVRLCDEQIERTPCCPNCNTILDRQPVLPARPFPIPPKVLQGIFYGAGGLLLLTFAFLYFWPKPKIPELGMPRMMGGPGAAGRFALGDGRDVPAATLFVEHPLSIQDTSSGIIREEPSSPAMSPASRIAPFIACAEDRPLGRLYTSATDGILRCYDIKTMREIASWRLPGPAYQLIHDPIRDQLILALARVETLSVNLLGEREYATGDLVCVSLGRLPEGKTNIVVEPTRTLASGVYVAGLHLSQNHQSLTILTETAREMQLRRLDLQNNTEPPKINLPHGGGASMTIPPDDSLVFVCSAGRLISVNPASWTISEYFTSGGAIQCVLALSRNRVCMLERRGQSWLNVIDLPTRKSVLRWEMDLEGKPTLAQVGDSLWIGTSAVVAGRIWQLSSVEDASKKPILRSIARSNKQSLLRGGLFVARDGSWAITSSGHWFRTPVSSTL